MGPISVVRDREQSQRYGEKRISMVRGRVHRRPGVAQRLGVAKRGIGGYDVARIVVSHPREVRT